MSSFQLPPSTFPQFSGGGGATGNSSSSLFGGSSNTGGSLFGGSNNNSGSLFGNTNTNTGTNNSGSLFGNTGNSGSLFGNTTGTGSTGTGGGTSLFGNTGSSGNTGGGSSNLFGNSGGGGTSLFGNSGGTGGTGTSLFGNTGTGGAGSTGSLFGNTGGSSGLFGNTGGGGGGGSLFGNSQQQNSNSLFGPSSPTNFNRNQPINQNTSDPSSDIDKRVLFIKNSYDPRHPNCRFHTFFYNRVDPKNIDKYVKPENVSMKSWARAVKNNPDPTTLVPTLAVGFKDLKARIKEQEKAATVFQQQLEEESRVVSGLCHNYNAAVQSAMIQCRATHLAQSQRLLNVLSKLELLRSRDIPLLMDEFDYRRKLEHLQRTFHKPASFLARVRELDSIARFISERNNVNNSNSLNNVVIDPETMASLQTILINHKSSISFAAATIKADTNDLNTIINQQNVKTQEPVSF